MLLKFFHRIVIISSKITQNGTLECWILFFIFAHAYANAETSRKQNFALSAKQHLFKVVTLSPLAEKQSGYTSYRKIDNCDSTKANHFIKQTIGYTLF